MTFNLYLREVSSGFIDTKVLSNLNIGWSSVNNNSWLSSNIILYKLSCWGVSIPNTSVSSIISSSILYDKILSPTESWCIYFVSFIEIFTGIELWIHNNSAASNLTFAVKIPTPDDALLLLQVKDYLISKVLMELHLLDILLELMF